MKVGDLVRWSDVEECYYLAQGWAGPMIDLTEKRKRGVVIDRNPHYFFVYWENGELIAQKPNTIEVISES